MITLTKATSDAVASLFHLAFTHEAMEGDTHQQHRLIDFANQHKLIHLLPNEAHGMLHDQGVPHKHDGMPGEHEHIVTKAFNPVGKDGVILKAWGEEGKDCFIEGWLSTPDSDMQNDIVEPEAFTNGLDSFFARAAPTSFVHNGQTLPAGHLQKAAIVRDGVILKAVTHPTDAAEFEHFPGTGSGVFVRGVLNAPEIASAVRKGNVRGFSFIGNGKTYAPRYPKGHHYTEINPLIESTVAPYPVNTSAIIMVAKAFGLAEPVEKESMSDSKLEQLLTQLLEREEETVQKSQPVTLEAIAALLATSQETVLAAVDTKVQKAMELVREEGAGSKMPVIKSVLPNENPLYPIVMKANKGEELNEGEIHLLNAATHAILASGMNESGDAAMSDWFRGVGDKN